MAYIGKEPVNGFHKKQSLTTDGSTVTFSLDFTVASEESIIVVVGGVIQEPRSAYNLASGGTQITFTAAPASTDTAYIIFLGTAVVQNLLDLSGGELILDADDDTTITADTDDQIDIKIAGADDFQFTANKFSVLSGSNQEFADNSVAKFGASQDMTIFHDGTDSLITNKTGAMKIATETSGIAVTIGHTTSETTVADNLTVTGNLTVGGTTSFGDFDITNVGSIALDSITNDGTDITLDSSNDIVIDAEGGNIEFKDAGTLQLTLDMDGTAGAQVIKLGVDSDDLIFQQYDGNEVIRIGDDRRLYFFDKGGEYIVGDGTDLSIFASGDINIPANVGLTFGDDGEKIEGNGTNLTIASSGTMNFNNTGLATFSGALTVTGDLTINGSTTTNSSTNTTIADNIIELNSGISSSGNDIGFIFERGSTGNNACFIWDETEDRFTLGTTTATGADKSGGITVSAGTLAATCTAAQYSDVAERYHADAEYGAGTIVELGGVNEITRAATELSEEVFGVVSSNDTAAFMMNDRAGYNDRTHPFVAMTGRVPTNVVGTVTKGARLVTSSTPGYARMAQPGEATAFNVLGRALEAKTDAGQGKVLAVVSIKI